MLVNHFHSLRMSKYYEKRFEQIVVFMLRRMSSLVWDKLKKYHQGPKFAFTGINFRDWPCKNYFAGMNFSERLKFILAKVYTFRVLTLLNLAYADDQL